MKTKNIRKRLRGVPFPYSVPRRTNERLVPTTLMPHHFANNAFVTCVVEPNLTFDHTKRNNYYLTNMTYEFPVKEQTRESNTKSTFTNSRCTHGIEVSAVRARWKPCANGVGRPRPVNVINDTQKDTATGATNVSGIRGIGRGQPAGLTLTFIRSIAL